MALAIRLEHLIETGQVADQAEIARTAGLTRARPTQVLNRKSGFQVISKPTRLAHAYDHGDAFETSERTKLRCVAFLRSSDSA